MTTQEKLDPIISDLESALISHRAYKNIISLWQNKTTPNTPQNRLLTCAVMEALERDMILALCRLDDEKNLSFHTVKKNPKDYCLSGSDVSEISKSIAGYRKKINPIKTQNRNRYIAHLSKNQDSTLPSSPVDIGPLLRCAINTMNTILKKEYDWKVDVPGSDETIALDDCI